MDQNVDSTYGVAMREPCHYDDKTMLMVSVRTLSTVTHGAQHILSIRSSYRFIAIRFPALSNKELLEYARKRMAVDLPLV